MSLGWGMSWPIMKMVISEVPLLYSRGICLLLGGIGMLAISHALGISVKVASGDWRRLCVLALFNIVGWNGFVVYGVSLLPAGRSALLGYTMPLWSVILSACLLGEPITRRRALGLVLGLGGIIALISDSLGGMARAPVGVICMLLAAWSWGLGIVLIKRLPVRIPTIALTGWMMLIGAIPLLALAVPLETTRLIVPSFWPAFGLVYNTLIAFMFCYWAWNRIVLMVPVAVSSLSALTTPLIGVVSGVVFLGEQIGWREIIAALLILAAVGTVSIRR
jgi:drug/metabolite transporter (DMT)-like permease